MPSNDSLNVGDGVSLAHGAHRLVQATRDTSMDGSGSKLERFSHLAVIFVFLLKRAPGDQSVGGISRIISSESLGRAKPEKEHMHPKPRTSE